MSTQKKKTTNIKSQEPQQETGQKDPSTLIQYILNILRKLVSSLEKSIGEESGRKDADSRATQDLIVDLMREQMDEEDALLVFDLAIVGKDGLLCKRTQGQTPLPSIFNDKARVEAQKRMETAYFSAVYGPFRTQWQLLLQDKLDGFQQPGVFLERAKEPTLPGPEGDEEDANPMTEEE